ncbi:MAG TPA: hypothetical protein VNB64_00040 [Solirubrobacteraceae bacterium]|nr:hypothetical protein [Solirubrobacteraceae bacterium]
MKRSLGLAAALLALGAGACGGDDAPREPDARNYLARADSACADQPPPPAPPRPAATLPVHARYLHERLIPSRELALARLRAVRPDAARADAVARYVAAVERTTDQYRGQAAAYARGDWAAGRTAGVTAAQGEAAALRVAAEVGFRRCGQPRTGPPVTPRDFESPAVRFRADAACRVATDSLLARPLRAIDPPALAGALAAVMPEQRRAIEVLRRLRRRATRPAYARFLAFEVRRYALLAPFVAAGRARRDREFYALADRNDVLYLEGEPVSRRLGFAVCGVSSPEGF